VDYELVKEMMQWIKKCRCGNFYELCDYAITDRFDDWFPLLCDCENVVRLMAEYVESYDRNLALDRE